MKSFNRQEENDGLRGGCSALLRLAGRRDPRGVHPFFPGIPPRNWSVATAPCARLLPAEYGDGGEERVGSVFDGVDGYDADCGAITDLVSQSLPRFLSEKDGKEVEVERKPKGGDQKEEEDKDLWWEFWGGEIDADNLPRSEEKEQTRWIVEAEVWSRCSELVDW